MQLVRPDVPGRAIGGEVDLADQRARRSGTRPRSGATAGTPRAPPAWSQASVLPRRRIGGIGRRITVVGQPVRLDQAVRHVDPQPVHPAVEPEPDHLVEERRGTRVAPVPVRLLRGVEVQVPLVAGAGPGRAAEHARPVVRPVGEVEPRPLRAARLLAVMFGRSIILLHRIRLLLLSATIGNAGEFAAWIEGVRARAVA